MILNDKPNCQVLRILRNPCPIYVKRSENYFTVFLFIVSFYLTIYLFAEIIKTII
jgi:hypothetical protein